MAAILERHRIRWPNNSMSKLKWKKTINEAVHKTDQMLLVKAKAGESKLDEYAELHKAEEMPRYLRQRRSWVMSYGRSIKTKLRCGTTELELERGRYETPKVPRDLRLCKCCTKREVEDSWHFTMRCPRFKAERLQMMNEISDTIEESQDYFKWNKMNMTQKWKFLLGDGPPVHDTPAANRQWGRIEISLYRFLVTAYKARRQYVQSLNA